MSAADGGIGPTQPLFVLRGANFQLATDQAFTKLGGFTSYIPAYIAAVRKTGAASVACLGGIYPSVAKGGAPIVAASQSWLGLSGAGTLAAATLASVVGATVQTATPILSLTTGSTAAVTADVFIFGYVVD